MEPSRAKDHVLELISTLVTETTNAKVEATESRDQSAVTLKEVVSAASRVSNDLLTRLDHSNVRLVEVDQALLLETVAVEKSQKRVDQLREKYQNETTKTKNSLIAVKVKIERSKEDDKSVGALFEVIVALKNNSVNLTSTRDNLSILAQVREGVKRHNLKVDDQALMQLLEEQQQQQQQQDEAPQQKATVENMLTLLRQEIHESLVMYEQQYTNLQSALVQFRLLFDIEMEEAMNKLAESRGSLQRLQMTQSFLHETIQVDESLLESAKFLEQRGSTELANLEAELTSTVNRLNNRSSRLADTIVVLQAIPSSSPL